MTATGLRVHEILSLDEATKASLASILVRVVNDGAAVGFLAPLDPNEAEAYWARLPRTDARLIVATIGATVVGTAQVHLAGQANGRHRAEVAKVLVDPAWQRQGIGRTLIAHAEAIARNHGRTTLVLDTREGDPSNRLYRSSGWREIGRIPEYARSSTGELHATVIYAKWDEPNPSSSRRPPGDHNLTIANERRR
ncbi:MAG: GNAT family N-acetyltransferase [Chloroflexi bacterium]|nr:GNAT family N-acetyltransferase [Chloroflexota bacterium]